MNNINGKTAKIARILFSEKTANPIATIMPKKSQFLYHFAPFKNKSINSIFRTNMHWEKKVNGSFFLKVKGFVNTCSFGSATRLLKHLIFFKFFSRKIFFSFRSLRVEHSTQRKSN